MTLDQYSSLLVVGSSGLFALLVVIAMLSFVSSSIRDRLNLVPYHWYIGAIATASIAAILGSLVFQLVYETPVCELCWWQRIFLYPISVIALVALWYRSRETHITIAILSALGLWYAGYHYYFHFQRFVLGNTLSLPCSYGGLMPACTDSPILIFGFATIPFLAMAVFATILILCAQALRIDAQK